MVQRYGHISTEARREAMEAAHAARAAVGKAEFNDRAAAKTDDAIHQRTNCTMREPRKVF